MNVCKEAGPGSEDESRQVTAESEFAFEGILLGIGYGELFNILSEKDDLDEDAVMEAFENLLQSAISDARKELYGKMEEIIEEAIASQ